MGWPRTARFCVRENCDHLRPECNRPNRRGTEAIERPKPATCRNRPMSNCRENSSGATCFSARTNGKKCQYFLSDWMVFSCKLRCYRTVAVYFRRDLFSVCFVVVFSFVRLICSLFNSFSHSKSSPEIFIRDVLCNFTAHTYTEHGIMAALGKLCRALPHTRTFDLTLCAHCSHTVCTVFFLSLRCRATTV